MNKPESSKKFMIASSKKTQKPSQAAMIIGKDILELISGGMYIDPMSMVREYIQNAVDAIDEAAKKRKYKNKTPEIRVSIDHNERSLAIRDNGIGLSGDKFARSMLSVGASQKIDTDARGFRGVGRFAGLTYCRELIFRSSAPGEKSVSEIRWDGVKFKRLVSDRNYSGDLKNFLKDIAELSSEDSAKSSDHFFEVELKGILRYKNDQLLNENELYNYLSQHAPVPFSPEFSYGKEIEDYLEENNVYSAYNIYVEVDDYEMVVYRPHRDIFEISEIVSDKFNKIEFISIEGLQGGICAVGWILHHSYFGVIPERELIRGLRVREGNIQIGKGNLLTDAFPEPRFNSWSVGEFHIVNRVLVPTGRRDDFEVNTRYADFVNKIASYGRKIAKICRQNSQVRNKFKEFELEADRARVNVDVLGQGAISRTYRKQIDKNLSVSLDKMSAAANSPLLSETESEKLLRKIGKIESSIAKFNGKSASSDPLANFSKREQDTYKRVFDLIYECAPNKVVAQKLIDQILVRLPK
ncbi:MAG: hypothetical protein GKR91_05910 [Pseudomonadales bacterium]|nr:hypothetical protein [Pseudomonadales bacterium]